MIRKATEEDLSRIAEIFVFNIGRRHNGVYCKADKGGRKCAVGRETNA